MWNQDELEIIRKLDAAIRSASAEIDIVVSRVEQEIAREPNEVLAWEPIPLTIYNIALPETIRSSWVFVLRAGTTTGAERHPNSHQRMMSYRGSGDFQTKPSDEWNSNLLVSDLEDPPEKRWISIPANIWHQGVIGAENWVVVSFHTVTDSDLIEERPCNDFSGNLVRRNYISDESSEVQHPMT